MSDLLGRMKTAATAEISKGSVELKSYVKTLEASAAENVRTHWVVFVLIFLAGSVLGAVIGHALK